MMDPLWNARFIAKVLGVPAVMLGGIFAFPLLVYIVLSSNASDGLKVFVIAPYALAILGGVGWRMCRGGEQGPTDIVIEETATSRVVTVSNVPLASGPTGQALDTFRALPSVPRPVGRVIGGNPSMDANLVVDAKAALPEHVPVAERPLEVPPDAASLSVSPQPASATAGSVNPTVIQQ